MPVIPGLIFTQEGSNLVLFEREQDEVVRKGNFKFRLSDERVLFVLR